MPEPSLAIVIVSYNVRADLERCLRSLVGHTPPFPATIAVVDNGSADGTLQMVRRDWPTVRAIDAGGNVGFSRGSAGSTVPNGGFVFVDDVAVTAAIPEPGSAWLAAFGLAALTLVRTRLNRDLSRSDA